MATLKKKSNRGGVGARRRHHAEAPLSVEPAGKVSSSSPLLTEAEAAAYIRVSRSFLRQSRMNGDRQGHAPGPAFIRRGGMIFYHRDDLDRWIADGRIDPAAAVGA